MSISTWSFAKARKCLSERPGSIASGVLLCLLISGCGGSSSSSVGTNAIGSWGSKSAELDITATKVTYTNTCSTDTLTGTVTLNSDDDFIITGPFPANRPLYGFQYIGHIQNRTLHLTIIDPTTNTIFASEDLTYGVSGQVPFLTCP